MKFSPRLKDRTGKKYGRLTVIRHAGSRIYGRSTKLKFSMWLCLCDCGKEVTVRGGSLEHNNSISCGCYHRERLISDATTHGLSHTPLFNCWLGIMARCYNKKSSCYKFYGKKGIRVCKRWHKKMNFFRDMGPTWQQDLTLERKNVYGDYRPGNCCWITRDRQAANKTTTRWIVFNGKRQSMTDWGRELGFERPSVISQRLASGWSLKRAMTTPVRKMPPAVRRIEKMPLWLTALRPTIPLPETSSAVLQSHPS